MTRKRMIGGAVAFVAALLMSVAALAQHGGPGGHRGPGGPGMHGGRGGHGDLLEHFARELNLTDAQKAQVKQIEDALRESTKSLHEQMAKSGGPLDGFKDGFDEAAVRSAAQARAAVHVELEVAHARAMSQIYSLLTAEQKAKLAELRKQFGQRRPGPPPADGEQ